MLHLFLIAIVCQTTDLEGRFPSAASTWPANSLLIHNRDIIVGAENGLYRYSLDDDSLHLIISDDTVRFGLGTCAPLREHFFVSVYDEKKWRIVKYAYNQPEPLSSFDQTYSRLRSYQDRLYGIDTGASKTSEPMLYRLDPETLRSVESFFKRPGGAIKSQNQLWLEELNDFMLIVLGSSPQVYFSYKRTQDREQKLSGFTPGNHPFKLLDAPEFTQITSEATNQVLNEQEKLIALGQLYFETSETLFFGKVGNGFLYCWSVPDYLDGLPVGNHLALRFFNARLEPVGPVHHRYGQIAGVSEGHAVVFYPDGPMPEVGNAGIQKIHGIDSLSSRKELSQFLKKYQVREKRILKPHIERIPYPAAAN